MKPGTLLLVDDDRLLLDSMTTWLREQGYDVSPASGREAAFRELAGRRFDLVLADIRLADGDGLTFWRIAASAILRRPSCCSPGMRRWKRASRRCGPGRLICLPSR
jgi:DNA-binding NtrC family response regulator